MLEDQSGRRWHCAMRFLMVSMAREHVRDPSRAINDYARCERSTAADRVAQIWERREYADATCFESVHDPHAALEGYGRPCNAL